MGCNHAGPLQAPCVNNLKHTAVGSLTGADDTIFSAFCVDAYYQSARRECFLYSSGVIRAQRLNGGFGLERPAGCHELPQQEAGNLTAWNGPVTCGSAGGIGLPSPVLEASSAAFR
jgi:hypothetical protein